MTLYRSGPGAFGAPGLEPRWAPGDKDGVGTAYSASSLIWFTLWNGIVTEVYYPTVDRPQIRDLQFLITDGETFLHQEIQHLHSQIKSVDHALAYDIQEQDPDGRYSLDRTILTDPHQPCLLIHTHVRATVDIQQKLKLYVLCAPHLEVGGDHNSGYVMEMTGGGRVLVAQKGEVWMALMASQPFSRASVGYVGRSDGYTDLVDGYKMKWEFDRAEDGNIALTGEIPLNGITDFTVGLAFGNTLQRALTTLYQCLAMPFALQRQRYAEQWKRSTESLRDLSGGASDGGELYSASCQLLLAHEDKTYQGALIASLAIPWGHVRGDQEGAGGYHLVWPRDMVQCSLALLAVGNIATPLRSLIYLATAQMPKGGFAQNFWINGSPFWQGIQLDEAAFPILLAYRLWKEKALAGFDPLPMIIAACAYLVLQGPVTGQDRWEESSGYSPSTLAACMAAFIAAGAYLRSRHDPETAQFLEEYADFFNSHLEEWTVTRHGDLVDGIPCHFVRINPAQPGTAVGVGAVDSAFLKLTSQAPGQPQAYPARNVVDGGFLELVRYGIRAATDPLIERSVRVIDQILKVETPSGTTWHRYNHDGYGQQSDGGPYDHFGVGRIWPLLAGERGHFEIAAGRLPSEEIRSMEGFSTPTHMLPEQSWDEPDLPAKRLHCGRPTGSAVPLLWAHAEYIKLLRSSADEKVYERVVEAEQRYLGPHKRLSGHSIWSFSHPTPDCKREDGLRLVAAAAFTVRWTSDEWKTANTLDSSPVRLGIHFADLSSFSFDNRTIVFTFFWKEASRWEGKNFTVDLV